MLPLYTHGAKFSGVPLIMWYFWILHFVSYLFLVEDYTRFKSKSHNPLSLMNWGHICSVATKSILHTDQNVDAGKSLRTSVCNDWWWPVQQRYLNLQIQMGRHRDHTNQMSMGQTSNINGKADPVYYRREQDTWKLERRCVTECGGWSLHSSSWLCRMGTGMPCYEILQYLKRSQKSRLHVKASWFVK